MHTAKLIRYAAMESHRDRSFSLFCFWYS